MLAKSIVARLEPELKSKKNYALPKVHFCSVKRKTFHIVLLKCGTVSST